VARYISRSADPEQEPIGCVRLSELTIDAVAAWSAANERTLAPTTAVFALTTLRQICRYAVRRDWLATDPVRDLEPAEKPRWRSSVVAALEGTDLSRVLDRADRYRPLFEIMAFTGLRVSEALGLIWGDVAFDTAELVVRRQLSRERQAARLKTDSSAREIVLAPGVLRLLREVWLTSPFKAPDDLVFCTRSGRGLSYRRVAERFSDAVDRASLRHDGRVSLHSLRHGYASLLIAQGLDVVFVSRQLGHAKVSTTLDVYSHEFARREHAERARDALEAAHQAMRAWGASG
jgi:integrase